MVDREKKEIIFHRRCKGEKGFEHWHQGEEGLAKSAARRGRRDGREN
jgi:hypothetical protein